MHAKCDVLLRDVFPPGASHSRREAHRIPAGKRPAPLNYALGTTYNTPCYYLAGRVFDAANQSTWALIARLTYPFTAVGGHFAWVPL